MNKRELRKLVHLIAYTQSGAQVLEQFLDVDTYYEKSHPLLDEDEFRKVRGVIRVYGKIYDAAGAIAQELELRYNEAGTLVREAARLGDGTVIGNWDELTADGRQAPGM